MVWLAVVLVVAGIASYAVLSRRKQTPEPAAAAAAVRTATAKTGTLNRVIRVTGQTAAMDYSSITTPMMKGPDANREMVLMEVAPPGSWVKRGTLVAKIDGQSILDHIDDLADTIQQADSDIRKRKAEQAIELENLAQNLRLAKSDVDKAVLDYNGSETQTDIQRQLLKLNVDQATAQYKQLQADIIQKKASHAAEIRILELTLIRHTRHRNRHKKDAEAFTVYAAMDGLVVMQQIWRGSEMGQVQQGDRVYPGQPIMKIVNTKKMQVEGNINQAETSDLRIGQPVRIKLDAFNGLEFDGKVHSIGALANGGWRNSYYVRNVPVRIDIQGNDPKLIPDLSAGADVVISSVPGQTLIPLAGLESEEGKSVVYVRSGEGYERREVTPGQRNQTEVAIASGIRPGDVVRLSD